MKKLLAAVLLIVVGCAFLTACRGAQEQGTPSQAKLAEEGANSPLPTGAQATDGDERPADSGTEATHDAPQQNMTLRMTIGGTPVSVAWEDNDAVDALRELCRSHALTIDMSRYGGFEQVGSIGANLPRDDVQTATTAGDIVLYSGDQIVVFYGSNTWAYTRLGHITDQDADGMTRLLANDDTTITISLG